MGLETHFKNVPKRSLAVLRSKAQPPTLPPKKKKGDAYISLRDDSSGALVLFSSIFCALALTVLRLAGQDSGKPGKDSEVDVSFMVA